MPAGQGKDAERFAAAVELGRPPGDVDADLLHDLEIVAMLRSEGAAYSPAPDAKARAKERLMAALAAEPPILAGGAPTPQEQTAPLGRVLTPEFPVAGDVDEVDPAAVTMQMPVVTDTDVDADDTAQDDAAVSAPVPLRPGRRPGRHTMPARSGSRRARPDSPSLRRRVLLVGSAALITMIALAGGGVLASRDALPGDALYALKRVSESTGLALTFDEEARARRHLELATTRLDEIERLLARRSADAEADAELFRSTIRDFDVQTGEGSRMLLAAEDAGGAAALGDLRTWAAEQVARLSALRSALPVPAVAGADDSIGLLDRLLGRTEALESRSDCTEVTSGVVDDLGPLPAEGACSPRSEALPGTGGAATGTPGGGAVPTTPGPTAPGAPGPTTGSGQGTGGTEDSELVPGLGVPGVDGSSSTSTSPAPSSDGDDNISVPLPLPLLPPITLPPLLPGQPGITIG